MIVDFSAQPDLLYRANQEQIPRHPATEQIAQQEIMNPVHPVREATAQPQEPAVVNPHPEVVIDPPPPQFPNEV